MASPGDWKMTMGGFGRCPHCHRYGWSGTHACPPKWEVVSFYEYEEADEYALWQEFFGQDAEEAARTFVESRDGASELTNVTVVVIRRLLEPEKVYFVAVYGDLVPEYTSDKLPDLETAQNLFADM